MFGSEWEAAVCASNLEERECALFVQCFMADNVISAVD